MTNYIRTKITKFKHKRKSEEEVHNQITCKGNFFRYFILNNNKRKAQSIQFSIKKFRIGEKNIDKNSCKMPPLIEIQNFRSRNHNFCCVKDWVLRISYLRKNLTRVSQNILMQVKTLLTRVIFKNIEKKGVRTIFSHE